jgi:outer membrane receptor protein involved in Fe transport
MYRKTKLARAVTTAIASGAVGVSGNAVAQDDDSPQEGSRRLEEVIVTASKREESLQSVPIAVQAMDAAMLDDLDINTFEDWVKQAPSVNFSGRGPGQNSMFIRGVSANPSDIRKSGGLSSSPTVALYLDDAPLISNGRNIDLYITDLQRIEVLPGPQGTLYGASSQAGTVRLVTNKPDLVNLGFGIGATMATTRKGDPSWGLEGHLNIPIVQDRLAVRIVGYNIERGGWIDNVPGTTSYADSEFLQNGSIPLAADAILPSRDNADVVEDNFNSATYRGGRISGRLAINDDWELTAGVVSQNLEVDGVFDYLPREGDLNVVRFNPDHVDDEIRQFNWNLEGRLAQLDVVYNGSFLKQDISRISDYSINHENVSWMVYYNCIYNDLGEVQECAAPDAVYLADEENEYTHHELRISTDQERSLRFIGGVWYSDSENKLLNRWTYHAPELVGFAPNAPYSGTTVGLAGPGPQPPEIAWFHTVIDQSDELAVFGELTYDFTDQWSATVGARWFDVDINVLGSYNPATLGPVDQDWGGSLDAIPPASESDTIFKANLTYRASDAVMLYGTFSQGFRRGRFNRQGAVYDPGTGDELFPALVNSDSIDNYEIGWKTQLWNDRLRLNGAAYFIEWTDMHNTTTDPVLGNVAVTTNSGTAEIKGVEANFTALLMDNLTLNGAVSINDAELTDVPPGTQAFVVPEGSTLALSPKFQGNLNFRYDFDLAGRDTYATFGIHHRGSSYTSINPNSRLSLDSYTLLDGSVGMILGQWKVSLVGTNLADERPELFRSSIQGPPRINSGRPRTFTVRVSYDYN